MGSFGKKNFIALLIVGTPLLIGLTIVGSWFWSDVINKKPPLPKLGLVPEFSLVAEDKRHVTLNNLMGKVTVADFIFTECGGACPMMSTQMSNLQKQLSDEPQVEFVSFSVDPETDTPEVLAGYAKQYNAKKEKWMFLTGGKPEIFKLTRDGFHLAVDADTANGGIFHSQKFVLIDPDATIRGYYDSEDSLAMKSLMTDARRLVTLQH